MERQLILNILVFVICASFCAVESQEAVYEDGDWTNNTRGVIYRTANYSECVFPFTYNKQTYYNCTLGDGANGDVPWCSLTADYIGKFRYCYEFVNNDANRCVDGEYEVNSKKYTGCNFIPKTAVYKQCRSKSDAVPLRFCLEEHLKPTGKPLYHPDDCDDSYKRISKYHTMCMGPSYFAIPVAITSADQTIILNKHHSYRNDVYAKVMFKLYWDDELAKMAQVHANMCAFDHDLSLNRIIPQYGWRNGQNMVWSGAGLKVKLDGLLEVMFGSEKPRFTYGQRCPGGNCNHYTQLMLSTLTRVGCALTHCMYPDTIERLLVCNYVHSQYDDTLVRPYEEVKSADENICPASKRDATYTNLCDCGNKLYDSEKETLDPTTCEVTKKKYRRSIFRRDLQNENRQPARSFMIQNSDAIGNDLV